MKIRIKFAKRGCLKFVGHLDMLRYFQKLIRRAEIDIAYSEGFNPHQKMSFAQPLGVGMLSEGEYVDIDVNTTYSSAEAIDRLNAANVDGIEILSYGILPEGSQNAMASVSGADYKVEFRAGYEIEDFDFFEEFKAFYQNNESIMVTKETKKSTALVDLKPHIYNVSGDKDALTLKLSCGSVTNIKPELVMEAFFNSLNITPSPFTFIYTRLEVYGTDENNKLIPLEAFAGQIP